MNFVFRPSTRKGRHPGSLSLRLIHNRQVKTITLAGCRIYNEEWDKDFQTILYRGDNPSRTAVLQEVESVLCKESEVVRELIRNLEKRGR